MTVQELIDELNRIEEKDRDVQDSGGVPIEDILIDPFTYSISLYYEGYEDIKVEGV